MLQPFERLALDALSAGVCRHHDELPKIKAATEIQCLVLAASTDMNRFPRRRLLISEPLPQEVRNLSEPLQTQPFWWREDCEHTCTSSIHIRHRPLRSGSKGSAHRSSNGMSSLRPELGFREEPIQMRRAHPTHRGLVDWPSDDRHQQRLRSWSFRCSSTTTTPSKVSATNTKVKKVLS